MAYTTIDNPELYFQTKLYTGNGSTQSLTFDGSEDMQPDFLWFKVRNTTGTHAVFDSVRGTTGSVYRRLAVETDTAEDTAANTLTTIGSDGFSVGSDGNINGSSETMVAWCWKASGSTASNTDGTNITSTVDANTTSGFSIISWTGDNSASSTVGHGLGKTVEVIHIKNRADVSDWQTKHKNNSTNASFSINASDAESGRVGSTNGGIADLSGTTTFGFIAGSAGVPAANGDSDAMIAYAWNSVQGFSKIGTYEGNGNADGTFVYTGFRPAWVMRKVATGGTGGWAIYDNKREPENVMDKELFADTNSAEGSFTQMDFLSNGFKFRTSNSAGNGSGQTYIYMAFAEAPLVNSNGVPCNAR